VNFEQLKVDGAWNFVCPRCKATSHKYPSISRRDGETPICNDCGNCEAFEDAKMAQEYSGEQYWKIR
jgi:transposase-like protein